MQKQRRAGNAAAAQTALSVVVCTHGRADSLRLLLDQLDAQTLAPERFEVVAVDDASPEPVEADSHAYALRRLRQDEERGPGAARNLAFEHCRAPLVLLLNDDAAPDPGLLEGHLRAHCEAAERGAPERVAVLGRSRFAPELLRSPFVRLLDTTNRLLDLPELRHGELYGWRCFRAGNLSLPLAALRSVGGFDADLFPDAIAEDLELGHRLERDGWRVLYRDDLLCHLRRETGPRRYFDDMVRLGAHLARMFERHRDPAILGLGNQPYERFLENVQLGYEANRGRLGALVERLEGIERDYRGRELPEAVMRALREAVAQQRTVPFARGVLRETTGADPEATLAASPRAGERTPVVIVAGSDPSVTERCLEAVRAAQDGRHPIDLMVVDGGSDPGRLAFLDDQPDVQRIGSGDTWGTADARNRALADAAGDWVVFLDDDARVTPGWLRRLLYHAHADPRVGCVHPVSGAVSDGRDSGAQIVYQGDSAPEALQHFADQLAGRQHRQARYASIPSSACTLVRREVLTRIGGFDERFTRPGCAGRDFALRTRLAGFRNRVALDVFVHHARHAAVEPRARTEPRDTRETAWAG